MDAAVPAMPGAISTNANRNQIPSRMWAAPAVTGSSTAASGSCPSAAAKITVMKNSAKKLEWTDNTSLIKGSFEGSIIAQVPREWCRVVSSDDEARVLSKWDHLFHPLDTILLTREGNGYFYQWYYFSEAYEGNVVFPARQIRRFAFPPAGFRWSKDVKMPLEKVSNFKGSGKNGKLTFYDEIYLKRLVDIKQRCRLEYWSHELVAEKKVLCQKADAYQALDRHQWKRRCQWVEKERRFRISEGARKRARAKNEANEAVAFFRMQEAVSAVCEYQKQDRI